MDKRVIMAIVAAVILTALAVGIPAYTVGKNSTPANSEYYDSCETLSEYGGRIYYGTGSYYEVPLADDTPFNYDAAENVMRTYYNERRDDRNITSSYYDAEGYHYTYGDEPMYFTQYPSYTDYYSSYYQKSQTYVRDVSVHVVGNSLHIEVTKETCRTTAMYQADYPAGGDGPYTIEDCRNLLLQNKITADDITEISFKRTSEFAVWVSEIPLSSVSIMNVNSVPKESETI